MLRWLAGLVFVAAPPAFAGAWPQEKGHSLHIVTLDRATADTGFDDDGEGDVDVTFEKTELRWYNERGLGGDWTLIQKAVLQDVSFIGLEGRTDYRGPAAARIGLRRSFDVDGPGIWAVEADVGYQSGGEYVVDGELRYEDLTTDARLLYGRGFDWGYADLQAGYLRRWGRGPDTLELDATMGRRLSDNWSVSGSLFARSTGGATIGDDLISPSRSLKLKGTAVWEFRPGLHAELGWVQTVAGRNHVRDGGVTLGLWWRRRSKRD